MSMLNTRQIIILAAFCLPLSALIALSYTGLGQTTIPKIAESPTRHVAMAPPVPVVKPGSLEAERTRIKNMLKEAVAMTPEQYLQKKKTDPSMRAPNIDVRRANLARLLSRLEHMTPAVWAARHTPHPVVTPAAATAAPAPMTIAAPAAAPTQTPVPKKLPSLTPSSPAS